MHKHFVQVDRKPCLYLDVGMRALEVIVTNYRSTSQIRHTFKALSQPEIDQLLWSEKDTQVHPQTTVLVALLKAGKYLYPELNGMYL